MSDSNPPKSDENTPEPVTPEVEARAQRHTYILYGVMIFFVILPFIVLAIRNFTAGGEGAE